MSRIDELNKALERGKQMFLSLMQDDAVPFVVRESYSMRKSAPPVTDLKQEEHRQIRMEMDGHDQEQDADRKQMGRIGAGDNLEYMIHLLKNEDMAGSLQLIYIDPPFFSGAGYQASVQLESENLGRSPVLKAGAYEDRWGNDLEEYLTMLAVRFYLMRELLSDTGCFWVHMDWHSSHYAKMMLDEIFGYERFVNEVVWNYKSGGASKRAFAKKHDTLLFYSKTGNYKFHPQKEKSYNREGKAYRFKGVEEFQDEKGWYTMVNMKDVWSIDMVGRTSSERMGYATQKPEKLVERIVTSCSEPGDLCGDFFAGTGTLGAVCGDLDRRWILCDEGQVAVADQILRMSSRKGDFAVEERQGADEERTKPVPSVTPGGDGDSLFLREYRPDLSLVREEDRETVFRYLRDDSLSLVRFWSCQRLTDSGGEAGEDVHRGDWLLSGEEVLPLGGEEQQGEKGFHIVGYDRFGGRFTWRGQIEG